MNNKEIIMEEVQRILQIMEVSEKTTPLLNEGIIDDVIQGIVKVGTKSGDDALVVISKLEREFGIPKGVLDSDDVFDLIKGTSDEQIAVLSKIINKMGPKQVDDLAQKVWSQLSETHIQMDNIVRSIKDSNTKISPKYIDDMADATIKSKKPGFDPLIESLKSQFKKRMNDSLKGYIDVAGSSSKVTPITQQPLTPKITPKTDDTTLDGVINKFLSDPSTYPDYPAFKGTVELIGLKGKVTKMILANYKQYSSFSPDELIKAGEEITTNLNNKEWGWLKKLFVNVQTEKIKPKSVIKLLALIVALSILIPWGFTSYETSEKLRSSFEDKVGIGEYVNNEESLKKWASDEGIVINSIVWDEDFSEINEELYEFIDGSTGWVAV
jgi:hypothetical protein